MSQVALSTIRLDGGTQSRAELSEATIVDYCEALAAGTALPPPVVFYDGSSHWLADGFHRVHSFLRTERKRIECDVRQGSQRDAILFSVGANNDHGLRRTNADKRRSVEMLLRDEEWAKKSDRWVAEKCVVDHKTVLRVREELAPVGEIPNSKTRTGQDGKKYSAKKPKATKPMRADPGAAEPANDAEAGSGPEPEPEPAPPPARGKPVKYKCDGCEMYWSEPKASCVHCEQPDPFDDVEVTDATGVPADEYDDPEMMLTDLHDDIERRMVNWPASGERFVAFLEAWVRRARDHFDLKGTGT